MSFAPEVSINPGKWLAGYVMRFATRAEAEQYLFDLQRKHENALVETRVVESTDPVNYRIANNVCEAV